MTAVFESAQRETYPMLDFDERDLLRLAEHAGFFPKIPTFAEAMEQALTREERDALVSVLRPAVEAGRGVRRMGHPYPWAVKP